MYAFLYGFWRTYVMTVIYKYLDRLLRNKVFSYVF